MSNPVYITLTSTGTAVVNVDRQANPFGVSVGVVYGSTTMTATYGVEFTLDDQQYLTNIGSTRALGWFPDANLPAGQTAKGTTNYIVPIAGIRFTLSAISSSYVTFQVLQAGQ